MSIAPDPFAAVILDSHILVFFAMNENLFFILLIFKANLIKAAAPRRRIRLDRHLGLFIRQLIRWHGVGVIDASDDDWLIRIAFQEINNHFHSNTRDKDRTPLLAGP